MLGIVRLSWSDGLEVLGRYAAPDFASGNLGVLQHQGTSGHDGAFANLTAVEQGGTHADEGIVMDGAGMDGDVVADGHVVADVGRASLMGDVDAGTVLNVGAVADGDGSHVAAYHRIEPHGALVAHGDVAHDSGIFAEIAISPPFGSETAV